MIIFALIQTLLFFIVLFILLLLSIGVVLEVVLNKNSLFYICSLACGYTVGTWLGLVLF